MKMILAILVVLALGIGAGYYFGYDHGFEEAVQIPLDDVQKDKKSMQTGTSIKPSLTVARDIVGTWKSTDDAKFTRQFAADGTLIDRYESNDDAVRGMWKTFMSADGESVPSELKEGVVYLKIAFPEEVMFFSVPKITADSLEMVYLDGDVLKFTKVR